MKSSARRVTTAGAAWLHPAIITALGDGGLIEVRVSQAGGTSAVQQVRLAQPLLVLVLMEQEHSLPACSLLQVQAQLIFPQQVQGRYLYFQYGLKYLF